jgi:tetratricopeptide (TPR) repeat protein
MKKMLLAFLLLLFLGDAFATPSKKELFSRARDALKTSLINRDYERSKEAIEYLKSNLDEGAPFWDFEEYLALMEIGEYDAGIEIYANARRIVLDSSYNPELKRRVNPEADPLHLYLYRNVVPFTKATADSLSNVVENSNAKQENKELFTTLLYAELVIGLQTFSYGNGYNFTYRVIADTTAAENFLQSAKKYIEDYPHSFHAQYLKDQIVPFVQNYMDKQREFRRDPIAHKFYTGGIGLYAGTWIGFLCGEMSDVAETEMGTPLQFEVEFRVKRFSLAAFMQFGMIVKPKALHEVDVDEDSFSGFYGSDAIDETVDESFGVTLGFTAYDSHYLRVEPFMGMGVTYMPSFSTPLFEEYSTGAQWIMGANVDFRFAAGNPKRIGALSFAGILRFKYKVMLGTAESNTGSNGGYIPPSYGTVHHEFGLSVGFNLW